MWQKRIFNLIPILTLIGISIISHREWFNLNSILTFSDWNWWPTSSAKTLFLDWGAWIHEFWGLGTPNIQLYFHSIYSVWSFLIKVGMTYDQAVKINLFIPIAILGFLSPYVLSLKLTRSKLIAFVTALFYGSNTYFITLQTAHLPIALVNAVAPLLLYAFVLAMERNSLINWIVFTLSLFIVTNIEVRISYIFGIIFLIYFAIFGINNLKKYLKYLLISGLLFLLLNSYWLLPTILGGISDSVLGVAGRGLFGDWLYNINNSFTLFHWSWTGSYPDQNFVTQHIKFYFWLFPIIALSSIANKTIRNSKITIFFLLLSLLGIFLTKQSGQPFPNVYIWLYKHFPGFMLFRESSKLYLLTTIGYLGLIALNLNSIKIKLKPVYYASLFILLLTSFINLKPLINKSIDSLFISRNIPLEYNLINTKLESDPEFYRVLSVPVFSRWMSFSENHPRLSAMHEIEFDWNTLLKYDKQSIDLTDIEKMTMFFSDVKSKTLFDQNSIKYVVIPIKDDKNNDNYFKFYSANPEEFANAVSSMSGLIRTKEFGNLPIVFVNSQYRPHIYLTKNKETLSSSQPYKKVNIKEINPSHYVINIPPGTTEKYLYFTDTYNEGWKLRIGKFNWFLALFNKDYFISSNIHEESDAMLNSFYLETNNINNTQNQEVTLTLYFYPQSYFYIGLIISGLTALISLVILIINFKKKTYENN